MLPSLYEGFAIPPLEALSVGVPIILSNTSCLPEIYGTAAHYIDPYDYQSIDLDAILRQSVTDANTVLQKYSWQKSAAAFLEIFRSIDNSR